MPRPSSERLVARSGRRSLLALALGGGLALVGLLWSDGHAPGHHVHPGVDGAHEHHHHAFTGPHHHAPEPSPDPVEAPAPDPASESAPDPASEESTPPSTATVSSGGGFAEAIASGPTLVVEISVSLAGPCLLPALARAVRHRDGGGPRAPPR